jgi:glucokinase
MSSPLLYVGLDVGGTSMKAAVVDDNGKAFPSVSLPTEASKGQEYGLNQMCATIRRAIAAAGKTEKEIAAIGVATPGTMDIPAGIVLDPPNLRPWQNVPVRDYVGTTFGLPTAFQNDANAAAFGEYWVGAGRDVKSMVMFTLGTGIGGGVILHDKILEGQHSHGAEVGHMKIDLGKTRQCGCGRWGCLEAFASATAIVKRAHDAVAEVTGKSILKEMLATADEELPAKEVFQAADRGDEIARKVVDDTAYYLAVGAMNMMHLFDPDMVVFAGGMTQAGESFLNRIKHYVRELAFPVPAARTIVRYAALGSDAGFIGAAACARQLVGKK